MRTQIRIAQIERKIDYLNGITGSPAKPYSRNAKGKLKANLKNFHTYQAYGGVGVHRMNNKHGGVTVPIPLGTKRECYEALCNFINGIEFKS